MTLEEAINLAQDGDHSAIRALGDYYQNSENEDHDYEEAIKWYTVGAENGYSDCMLLAAMLGSISAYSCKELGFYDSSISNAEKALFWAEKALEKGQDSAKETILTIKGEMGIAYYYSSTEEHDASVKSEKLSKAISFMLPIYNRTSSKEVLLCLGLAITAYEKFAGYSYDDCFLAHSLLKRCVDDYFLELKNAKIAAAFLGLNYTYGHGCEVDYDKAVHYYQIANNAGIDCSKELSCFRPKLFGGYKFIG
ncbi:MAG: sel1 repeat family protein [Clostridia bacterium]|nr:sel1 repeat family protein [Clostridia bacterium]